MNYNEIRRLYDNVDNDELVTQTAYEFKLFDDYYYLRRLFIMSCLQNELILESLFEEVQEAFPYLSEEKQIEIAQKRFEDLAQ